MDKSVGLKDALKSFYPLLILIAAIELLIWVHWNSLLETAAYWDTPKYSYSYLVPLIAGGLLLVRRDWSVPLITSLVTLGGTLLGVGLTLCVAPFVLPDSIQTAGFLSASLFESIGVALSAAGAMLLIQQRLDFSKVTATERWIGLAILLGAEGLRLWATHTSHYSPERVSFIFALAGAFLMVGGMRAIRWAGRSIAFLIFMLPLPAVLDSTLAANLQTVACASSTYALQTVGVGAVRTGNVISVGRDGIPMDVELACSGLHMLTVLVALSFAVVLFAEIPTWQRIVIVISAVPIALIVNVIRITSTGILFNILPPNMHQFFHDGAGLIMPALAMVLLFLEYKVLTNLFIEDDEELVQPALAVAGRKAMELPVTAAPLTKTAAPRPTTVAAPSAPLSQRPVSQSAQRVPVANSGIPRPARPLPARAVSANPASAATGKAATTGSVSAGPSPAKPLPQKPIAAKPIAAKEPVPATDNSPGGN
jgi:exosortase